MAQAVGPLTSVELSDGRAFATSDLGTNVVVVDSSYATSAGLAVGDTLGIGGEDFEVVGIVTSVSSDATTASNTYIPLDTAQRIAGLDGQISTVYVQAASSDPDIPAIQSDLQAALPDASVKTQADLASSVSGSLSTASDLVSQLGTWLSVIVLAAAFLSAILFTISGISRRTREFGTLKAVGRNNGAVVRQVAGESLVQGAIGGALGVVVGLLGILAINLDTSVLSGSAATTTLAGRGGGGAFGGGPGTTAAATTTTDVALQIPVTGNHHPTAVGLAILGGLLAGAIGRLACRPPAPGRGPSQRRRQHPTLFSTTRRTDHVRTQERDEDLRRTARFHLRARQRESDHPRRPTRRHPGPHRGRQSPPLQMLGASKRPTSGSVSLGTDVLVHNARR